MTQTHEKKQRKQVELPTTIEEEGGHTILKGLALAELAEYQAKWKQKLADVPRIQLELRAINTAIRQHAR